MAAWRPAVRGKVPLRTRREERRTTGSEEATMPAVAIDRLSDDMLARFDQRAPVYDRENSFFDDDWQELVDTGYLKGPIPNELGGGGWLLDEYVSLQQRIGYVAPATSLATNM